MNITFDIDLTADKDSPAKISITFGRKLTIDEMQEFYTILGDLIKLCENYRRALVLEDDK